MGTTGESSGLSTRVSTAEYSLLPNNASYYFRVLTHEFDILRFSANCK